MPRTKKNSQAANNTKAEEKKFDYSVDKGVPVTSLRHSNLRDKFPFSLMNVGDSFLIPKTDPIAKNTASLHYAGNMWAKMHPGFAITSRAQLNGDRRVWRIK